jgi:hypothetical protein
MTPLAYCKKPMTWNPNLNLWDARPDNQAHLLLWDTPNEAEIQQLTFYNNAYRVNYRKNLLQRINTEDHFLNLHHHLDRELEAIKSICSHTDKSMVLLEGLDCLITYLYVQSNSHSTLFWTNLEKTRKLETLLWILLPHKLAPPNWSISRLRHISSE